MSSRRMLVALALSLCAVLAGQRTGLRADDDPAAKGGQAAPADPAKPPADEAAVDDRYKLPEGGVKELLAFIQELSAFRPQNRLELVEYRTKGVAAIKAAAEKILSTANDADKQLPGFDEVEPRLLNLRVGEMRSLSSKEKKQLLADVKTYLQNHNPPSALAVQAALQCGMVAEYGGGTAEQSAQIYRDMAAVLANSKDATAAAAAAKMEGAARRLTLVGQQMEVKGTELNGEAFDLASLRGKVVLVDFWATWCGPCLAELPNVKTNYDLYHEKGFEVVGISLDNDRRALDAFLEKEQAPWVVLHDGGWSDNQVAAHYGIMGIPTVILVDQQGKVVSTRARGPELGRQLAKLLGPAEPAETPPAAEEPATDKPAAE